MSRVCFSLLITTFKFYNMHGYENINVNNK
jgi:hypothetical protein